MASILNVFEPKTKILSAEVNENFELVQSDVAEMGRALNNFVESEVTSLQSNLSSAQATLQNNINTVVRDLSSFKTNIYDNIAPNRGAGYSIASGWTAPKAGWVNARHDQPYDNQYLTLWIDGAVVFEIGNAGSYSAGDKGNAEFFVNKGSNVTFSGSGNIRVTFFPCKGV